jgi:hypothetical protein
MLTQYLCTQSDVSYRSYQAELLAQHTEITRLREALARFGDSTMQPTSASLLPRSSFSEKVSRNGDSYIPPTCNEEDDDSKQAPWSFFDLFFEDEAYINPNCSKEILRL